MEIVIFRVALRNQKKDVNHMLYSEEYSDFFFTSVKLNTAAAIDKTVSFSIKVKYRANW